MTNIETLYGHIKDLTKQNMDSIILEMIEYGNPVVNEDFIIKITLPNGDGDFGLYVEYYDDYETGNVAELGNMFIGSNIIIDWGDNTTTSYPTERNTSNGDGYVDESISHRYIDSGDYTIRVSGLTGIVDWQTTNNTALTIDDESIQEIIVPHNLTTISLYFPTGNIPKIEFQWTTSNDIIAYNSIFQGYGSDEIVVPSGTRDLYIAKGYPSNKLVEKN